MLPLILLLPLFLFLIPLATPLGINCRGSSECGDLHIFHYDYSYNLIHDFYETLVYGNGTVPGGPIFSARLYAPFENIICNSNRLGIGSICLFLQGDYVPAQGVAGQVVVDRLGDLVSHGCALCGSVPLSGDNDPDKEGILTVNYVVDADCYGVC